MILHLLLEFASAGIGLPDRLTRALIALGMFVAGLAFLALAIFMTVKAANLRALSTLIFAGLFFALSFASFLLMYRAAKKPEDHPGEA
jgi:hypothetical protein